MKYDFDRMVNRYGTDCYKWDMITKRKSEYLTALGSGHGF